MSTAVKAERRLCRLQSYCFTKDRPTAFCQRPMSPRVAARCAGGGMLRGGRVRGAAKEVSAAARGQEFIVAAQSRRASRQRSRLPGSVLKYECHRQPFKSHDCSFSVRGCGKI